MLYFFQIPSYCLGNMITIQAIDSEGVVIREFTTNNPDKADAFRYGLEARPVLHSFTLARTVTNPHEKKVNRR